jgi:hypothetical protein
MSARDFDFLHGRWDVAHRKLRERLAGSTDWAAFGGVAEVHPVLQGLGNVDRCTFEGHEGVTLRLFDVEKQVWTIHWADSRRGRLDPPLAGRFENGVGLFYGDDSHEGRAVRVRFLWSSEPRPRWEQAFSVDGGETWETNWVMEFTRATSSPRDGKRTS